MNNVVDLATYWRQSDVTASTPLPLEVSPAWTTGDAAQATGNLDASALQRLNPDADLSKFLVIASKAIGQFEMCQERLTVKDALGADDALMATKAILSELLMYRDLSDAIGLIVHKCFQATCALKAVTDAPHLPEMLKRALQRTWTSPFMDFAEACDIVDKIEDVATPLYLPGYN
jgi:hypothetical protein